jgi:periplasmic protein TonB
VLSKTPQKTFFDFVAPSFGAAGVGWRACEFHAGRWFPQDGCFGCAVLPCRAAETVRELAASAEAAGRSNPTEKTKLSASPAEFNTMKAVRKLVVLLSVGLLPIVAAKASTPEQAYLETCRKDPGVPVPVAVVSPTVGPEFNGASVQLEFVVDESGKPAHFSVKSTTDEALVRVVVDAVKQWRFKPAVTDGKPVATKVALPVKIVDPVLAGDRYASFE